MGWVELYWRHHNRKAAADMAARVAARAQRRAAAAAKPKAAGAEFSYDAALRLIDGLGIDPFHTRDASMPLSSLDLMRRHLQRLDASAPLLALHVGNFLGVSLAYLADAVRDLHPDADRFAKTAADGRIGIPTRR